MQSKHLIRCALVLAAALPLCAQATPMGTKAGAWESTVTTTMKGLPKHQMPEFSKEDLAKLPPERRAMIEKMIAMQEGKPVSTTVKSCVKKSDSVKKYAAQDPRRPNCKKKIISQTKNSVVIDIKCSGKRPMHARTSMKAPTPTEMVATTDAEGPNGFTMHADTKAHWLGSSCEGIPQR